MVRRTWRAGSLRTSLAHRFDKEETAVAVKLRLMRMGKKKQPTFRLVAADSRSPRNGRFIEILGTYQPRLEPSVVKIDNVKAVEWLNKGAKPTETVEKLLKISGAWEHFEKGTTPEPQAAEPADAEPATS
jgi:small subunit ribosomal protein S16